MSVSPPGLEMELDGRRFNASASATQIGRDSCFRIAARDLQNVAVNITYSLGLTDGSTCVMRATVLLPPRAPPPVVSAVNASFNVTDIAVLDVPMSSVLILTAAAFPAGGGVCGLPLNNATIDLLAERDACAQRAAFEAAAVDGAGVFCFYPRPPVWPDIYGNLTISAGQSSVIEYREGFLVSKPQLARFRFEPNRNATTKSFTLTCQGWSGLPPALSFASSGAVLRGDLPASALGNNKINVTINVLHFDQQPVMNRQFFTFGVLPNTETEYASQQLQQRNFLVQQHGDTATSVIRIGDLVSTFYCNDDSAELGALVLQAINDNRGAFEYQLQGSATWRSLNVSAERTPFDQFRMIARFRDGSQPTDAFTTIQCIGSLGASQQSRQLSDFLVDSANGTAPVAALFLPANATLRYRATVPASWSSGRALLAFTAAEKLRPEEVVSINPLVVSSIATIGAAAGWVAVKPVTMGCDGQPWSGRERDICNICGGDGRSCVDCHGDPNGTAILNDCGLCVGGRTARDPSFGKDCSGRCNGTFVSPVPGVCYNSSLFPTSADYIRSVWCDGIVNSTARINQCGFCTGGFTGRPANFSVGPCGCTNDTACITGCDGIAEPSASLRKSLDKCSRCLLPTDPTRDICSSIRFSLSQPVCLGSYAPGQVVTIVSSNVSNSIVTATLRLLRQADRTFYLELPSMETSASSGVFVFSAPWSLQPGQYALQVRYTTSARVTFTEDVTGRNLTVFGPPALDGLSPRSEFTMEEGVRSVTVVGRGFAPSSELSCLLYCDSLSRHSSCDPRTGFLFLPANFINETAVTCNTSLLTDVRQPLRWRLSVMSCQPQQFSYSGYSIFRQYSVQLTIRSSVGPRLVSASEQDDGYTIRLVFNVNIVLRQSGCAAVLDSSSLILMGWGPDCYTVANALVIRKGRDSTVCSGSRISLRPNVVYLQGCDFDLAVGANVTNALVYGSVRQPPVVSLTGLSPGANRVATISSCDSFYLLVTVRNTIGQRLIWDIRCATGTTCQSGSLAAFRSNFDTSVSFYNGNDIPAGESYNITVVAQNECGVMSNFVSLVVQRQMERLPFTIDITGQTKSVSPDERFTAIVSVYPSKCYAEAVSSLTFNWKITGGSRAVSVDAQSITGRYFRLPAGRLQGGQTYNLSVCASLPSWPNAACGFIVLETQSRPLVLMFQRGSRSDIAATESLLDYLWILDPDYATSDIYCAFSMSSLSAGSAIYMQDFLTNRLVSSFEFYRSSSIQTADTIVWVPWPSPSRYALPSGWLNLTATCQRDLRRSSVSKLVQILPRPPPTIRFLTEPSTKPQSPREAVTVAAVVIAQEKTQVQWALDASNAGLGSLPLENCSVGPPLSDTCWPGNGRCFITLVLKPGTNCNFEAGASYRLLLIASASDGTAQAQFDFRVNAPPRGGALTVVPAAGVALRTLFAFTIWPNITDDSDNAFTYSAVCCRQGTSDQCVTVTSEPTPTMLFTTRLPSGNWVCGATAIDSHGASSDRFNFNGVVLVQAEQLTLASLTDMTININSIFANVDAPALGKMIIGESESALTVQERQKKTELVQGLATRDLITLDTNEPSASCSRAASSSQLLTQTKTNSRYHTSLVLSTTSMCVDAFDKTIAATSGIATGRDALISQGGTSSKMTVTDVKSVLDIVSGIYHSTLDVPAATDFQANIRGTVPAFCNSLNPNSLAQFAVSQIAVVRVMKTSFQNLGSASLEMGCDLDSASCLASFATRQQINLGSDLQSRFYNWSCGVTDCFQDGACAATILLDKDLLTPQAKVAKPTVSTLRSPLAYVGIFHPSNGANQNVSQLSSGVSITTNISGTLNLTSTSLICRRWNGADWTVDNCTTRAPFQSVNGTWHVTCVCYDISSFIGVFEGPPGFQAQTAGSSTTSEVSTITTTPISTTTTSATAPSSILMTPTASSIVITPTASSMVMTPSASSMVMTPTASSMVMTPTASSMVMTPTASSMLMTPTASSMLITSTASSTLMTSTSVTARVTVPSLLVAQAFSVLIRVQESYATVVTSEGHLRSHVTSQLARQLKLLESQISDVKFASGSVLISFTVSSQAGANTSAAAAVQLLVQLMNNRQLVILGLDNSSFTVSWDFLQVLGVQTTTATSNSVENRDGSVAIAVGAAVGCICIISVIFIIIVLFKRNCQSSATFDLPQAHGWDRSSGGGGFEYSSDSGVTRGDQAVINITDDAYNAQTTLEIDPPNQAGLSNLAD